MKEIWSPESVVMTDWAVDDKSMGTSPESIIMELLLLSLLYDEVLIQDEVFALSNKFSHWFSEGKYLGLLLKCFDIESLIVLKHPLFAYPDDLKELAQIAPILARANYISKNGTKNDEIFTPTNLQLSFYHDMDSCLLRRPRAQRPVGSLKKMEIMQTFSMILNEVLSLNLYKKWRNFAFKKITDEMAEDFIDFIEDPEKVIAKLKENNYEFKFVRDPKGKPVFNRSLGFLATKLYPKEQAKAMKDLIQTTFAAPFAWRENAAGRYSNSLRELLWTPAASRPTFLDQIKQGEIVSVQAHMDTQILLPGIDSDFVEAINKVRNSTPGRNLRSSMKKLVTDQNFSEQIDAWNGVADELASVVTKGEPFNIRTALVKIGKDFIGGSIAGSLAGLLTNQGLPNEGQLAEALIGGGIGIAGDHLIALLRNYKSSQKLREQIERSVQFRCSPIDIPPLATPVISNS